MTTLPPKIREPMLEAIGLSADEELAYRVLIAHPQANRNELARLADMGATRLGKALAALEAKGLASRSPRAGRAMVPAPPDIAIEAMIASRHEELERVRSFGRTLAEEFRRLGAPDERVELVEVIEGRQAIAQRFEQLQQTARTEVLILDQPPYALDVNRTELDVLGRGIAYRTLYDRVAFEQPGMVELLEQFVAAGEQARVLDGVPLKLALVDRSLALIPLDPGRPGADDAVLVRSPALLSGLAVLFETLWERGVPLQAGAANTDADGGPTEDDQRVLTLLAAGLKDEAIARQLGIGLRTVRRRVAELMEALSAHNRFQLALQAARRGWI